MLKKPLQESSANVEASRTQVLVEFEHLCLAVGQSDMADPVARPLARAVPRGRPHISLRGSSQASQERAPCLRLAPPGQKLKGRQDRRGHAGAWKV